MKQFAVIGLGRFGSSLARTLHQLGYEVLAIDNSEENIRDVSEYVTHAVQANATDGEVLKSLGIRNFDVVVVAIGDDIQANILTTVLVKEMGIKHVVAKAKNELHGKVLEKIGADKVVYPEKDMAVRLAHYLAAGNLLDYIELSSDYSISELMVPPKLVGKSLQEANLRLVYHINVLAIKRGAQILVSPLPETVVEKEDILVVLGKNKDLIKLELGEVS